jgi:hypothetical protein
MKLKFAELLSVAVAVVACGAGSTHPAQVSPCPTPPETRSALSTFVYLGAGDVTGEMPLLDGIVTSASRPGANLIIAGLGGWAAPSRYTVQPGDTLTSIAQVHSITLESLETANPWILASRGTWNVIISGETLSLPSQRGGNVFFAGKVPIPTVPHLATHRPIPSHANNLTVTETTHINDSIDAQNCDTQQKVAAAGRAALERWSRATLGVVSDQLHAIEPSAGDRADLTLAAEIALNALHNLGEGGLLVFLDPGEAEPPLPPVWASGTWLSQTTILVTPLDDPARAREWKSRWAGTGVSVITLDKATSAIELAARIQEIGGNR